MGVYPNEQSADQADLNPSGGCRHSLLRGERRVLWGQCWDLKVHRCWFYLFIFLFLFFEIFPNIWEIAEVLRGGLGFR